MRPSLLHSRRQYVEILNEYCIYEQLHLTIVSFGLYDVANIN